MDRHVVLPFFVLLVAGCIVRPTVTSEQVGQVAAPRNPGCVLEMAHPSEDLEQVGEVVVLDEEQRRYDDPALIALVRPAACRLGGEALIAASARPIDEGGARKSRDEYYVMRRKAKSTPQAPAIAIAPATPELPAIGIKGATNAKIRSVQLVPALTQLDLEVWPTSGTFLGVDISQSKLLELTDDRGVSLLSDDANIQTWSNDPRGVRLTSRRTVARDARRLIAHVRLALRVADTTTKVRATFALKQEKEIPTGVGVLHANRMDGPWTFGFSPTHPARKVTTITLSDLGERDRLIEFKAAWVNGKPLALGDTTRETRFDSGVQSDSRLLIFPSTLGPVEIELSVVTPKVETLDLEIVAAVPE